jgi:hypothetical protein
VQHEIGKARVREPRAVLGRAEQPLCKGVVVTDAWAGSRSASGQACEAWPAWSWPCARCGYHEPATGDLRVRSFVLARAEVRRDFDRASSAAVSANARFLRRSSRASSLMRRRSCWVCCGLAHAS